MNRFDASENQARRRVRSTASAIAVAAALAASLAQPAHAGQDDGVTAPAVPETIKVPEGNVAFLKGRATGTQNYACSPSGAGFAWVLFTPEATLFNRAGNQIITHFFDPNPDPADPNTDPRVVANGAVRVAWQARDTSTIWAKLFAPPSFDADFVRANSVPWLVLEVVSTREGPNGGDTLVPTTFVQRVNTSGGTAPSDGCAQASDVGKKAFIPYTADYFFFANPADLD